MAATMAKTGAWRLEIVKRSDVPCFEVLPKRWTLTVVAFIRLMLRKISAITST